MKQLPLFLLNAAAAAALCACGALDPIPLTELPHDAGAVPEDATVEDTGVDGGLDADVDLGPVDMGAPVTVLQRWFEEACAFSRRCEGKEPTARFLQPACAAPTTITVEQLVPPAIFAQLGNARFDQVLTPEFEAYLVAATATCDMGAFLEIERIFFGGTAEGDICGHDYDCNSLHCGTSTLSCDMRRCLPARVTGDACSSSGTCPLGDTCSGGLCVPLAGLDDPCPDGRRCESELVCSAGALCATRGEFGQPCSRTADGADTCSAGLVCTMDTLTSSMRCASGAGVGASCDVATTPCATGLRCDAGTCRLPGFTGATCSANTDCVDGFACVDARCAPRPILGQACTPAAPCLIGTCRSGTCQHSTAGFTCSRTSLLDPVPGCRDAYCEGGLCHTYLDLGDACEYGEDTCGPMGACGANQCQARGTVGTPCGGEPLPPCLTGLTCVGPDGSQTCQACD